MIRDADVNALWLKWSNDVDQDASQLLGISNWWIWMQNWDIWSFILRQFCTGYSLLRALATSLQDFPTKIYSNKSGSLNLDGSGMKEFVVQFYVVKNLIVHYVSRAVSRNHVLWKVLNRIYFIRFPLGVEHYQQVFTLNKYI